MSSPTSPNFAEKDEILVPIDAEMLEQKRLLGPIISRRRKIHPMLLRSDGRVDDIDPGFDATVEIPAFRESSEMLQYLGFDEPKAHEIWKVWKELGPDGQLKDFVDFAMAFADTADVWDNQDSEWTQHMEQLGINLQTIDAIMHPRYKEIRLTCSCNYWVRDTIQGRHEVLLALQRTSQIRGERLQEACEDATGKGKSGGTKTQELSSSSKKDKQAGAMEGNGSGTPDKNKYRTSNAVKQQPLPSTAPGKTTLWRGTSEERLQRVKIAWAQGHVDLEGSMSRGPMDFQPYGLYLAVHHETAVEYAGYAKHRGQGLPVVMRIDIPNNILEDMEPTVLTYGDDWRQLVFHTRRSQRSDLPKHLRLRCRKPLLIGPILKTHTIGVCKMKSWEEITEANLANFEKDGKTVIGIQYALSDEAVQDRLQGSGNGIDIELRMAGSGVSLLPVICHSVADWWGTGTVDLSEYRGRLGWWGSR